MYMKKQNVVDMESFPVCRAGRDACKGEDHDTGEGKNMSEHDSQLKKMLIDMLEWFHNFCEENNLRYYALGGTMLGAARHKGFIPWDDDIDVGMPRADYLRLEELMKNQPSERYILETPNSPQKDFFYPFTKLYDTQTTLVENTRYKIKRGIYLDIFPLDGMGNSAEEAVLFFRKIKWRRYLLLSMTTGIRQERSFYKNASVRVMRLVPKWVLNPKKLLHSLDALCREKDFDQCTWGGNPIGNWMEREIMPKRIVGKPTEYTFENLTIYGVEDYDGYLTGLYGNWQELPPPEKRKSHHDYLYCDLNKSFMDNESC